MKEVGTPLHVVVTPCGGAIRWKVTQQLDEWIGDDSEESSGDFLGGGSKPNSAIARIVDWS